MADAGLFWRKAKVLDVWQAGDPRGLAACLPGLAPQPRDTVVVKKYASAFFGTTLAASLHVRTVTSLFVLTRRRRKGLTWRRQVLNVDTLVICGVSTSGCVRATTLDAMQNGFRPMLVAAACGDRTPEIQQANLFDLDSKYADVVDEDEALARLSAGWAKEP
ncbi:Isochorismatase-like protein [Lasiosphaeria miniovina]|uniref:Isochorismatase-like protein n=1 Tax=Lasiosphaeria miniovina TaxID=1954250 RepID=A0AA40DRH2_9PEZI|nr:Isochorismatase-like protein [Lasiosphaeria miniovina]KAK0709293.1 Isochorismatase-like protein [Lasiosphaeria miniovina]